MNFPSAVGGNTISCQAVERTRKLDTKKTEIKDIFRQTTRQR